MAEIEDRWLSVDEICKYLGVSSDTVYRWIDRFGMPSNDSETAEAVKIFSDAYKKITYAVDRKSVV